MNGLAVVKPSAKGSKDDLTRVLLFNSRAYFQTVEEARTWMQSAEHREVEKMIASIRVS